MLWFLVLSYFQIWHNKSWFPPLPPSVLSSVAARLLGKNSQSSVRFSQMSLLMLLTPQTHFYSAPSCWGGDTGFKASANTTETLSTQRYCTTGAKYEDSLSCSLVLVCYLSSTSQWKTPTDPSKTSVSPGSHASSLSLLTRGWQWTQWICQNSCSYLHRSNTHQEAKLNLKVLLQRPRLCISDNSENLWLTERGRNASNLNLKIRKLLYLSTLF